MIKDIKNYIKDVKDDLKIMTWFGKISFILFMIPLSAVVLYIALPYWTSNGLDYLANKLYSKL